MANPSIDRLVGNAGYMRFIDDALGTRTKIPIVSWAASTTNAFADRTSSANYSKAANTVFRSSVPIAQSMTVDVKGMYHRSTTPINVVAELFDNTKPIRVELGFSPIDPYADIYAWVENFDPTLTIADAVFFDCTLRSEGEITDLTDLAAQQNPPGDDQ